MERLPGLGCCAEVQRDGPIRGRGSWSIRSNPWASKFWNFWCQIFLATDVKQRLYDTIMQVAPGLSVWRWPQGMKAKLRFIGQCLMENRSGRDACLTPAGGHAEPVEALVMIEPHADRP